MPGLERIRLLLGRLGSPELSLPPVIHIAGTNGKGSTCAFLRAALEAAGYGVHLYTSPHLVRFNERIRLAGRLIEDRALELYLSRVLDVADGIEPSFFEVTTAAAFLAFAEVPADACIVEVGLGGRLDATNVIPAPLLAGITQLGLDHQDFLGDSLEQIAAEKAGIAKAGCTLVTHRHAPAAAAVVASIADAAGARLKAGGDAWDIAEQGGTLQYRDGAGELSLPMPRLAGPHQVQNAGLAIALLRHQDAFAIPASAYRAAMDWVEWPARLQALKSGPVRDRLPTDAELWLDGGHNPAANVLAEHLWASAPADMPVHIIIGMLASKDAHSVLNVFAGSRSIIHAVPVPQHDHHSPKKLATIAHGLRLEARTASGVSEALDWISQHRSPGERPFVLIMGSLYLAGDVLRDNGQ